MRLDEYQVKLALRNISPFLKLNQLWIGPNFICYLVESHDVTYGEEPLRAAVGYQDEMCSMRLVDQVLANEGSIEEAVAAAKKTNYERRQKHREQLEENIDAVAREWQRNTGTYRQYFT